MTRQPIKKRTDLEPLVNADLLKALDEVLTIQYDQDLARACSKKIIFPHASKRQANSKPWGPKSPGRRRVMW